MQHFRGRLNLVDHEGVHHLILDLSVARDSIYVLTFYLVSVQMSIRSLCRSSKQHVLRNLKESRQQKRGEGLSQLPTSQRDAKGNGIVKYRVAQIEAANDIKPG